MTTFRSRLCVIALGICVIGCESKESVVPAHHDYTAEPSSEEMQNLNVVKAINEQEVRENAKRSMAAFDLQLDAAADASNRQAELLTHMQQDSNPRGMKMRIEQLELQRQADAARATSARVLGKPGQ